MYISIKSPLQQKPFILAELSESLSDAISEHSLSGVLRSCLRPNQDKIQPRIPIQNSQFFEALGKPLLFWPPMRYD